MNERNWNHSPVTPGPYACIAPTYGATIHTRRVNSVSVPKDCAIIQDSGAFSDGPTQRLTPAQALNRQRRHAFNYGYVDQITHRASYDLLIDEKWRDGVRSKKRWRLPEAESAVDATIESAHYLTEHRGDMALVLSAQGVAPSQYLRCVESVLPMLDNDRDMLGLGGWCIIGKLPKGMIPVFRDTIAAIMPTIAASGCKRVHVWGVLYAPALAILLYAADQFGIAVSTDSSGPSRRPAFGQWGYADWTDPTYKRPPVETRGAERARHVETVRDWLSTFRWTQYYQALANPEGLLQMEMRL